MALARKMGDRVAFPAPQTTVGMSSQQFSTLLPKPQSQERRVFISHTFQDKEACLFALLLNDSLQHNDIGTFFDFQMGKGQQFDEDIVRDLSRLECVKHSFAYGSVVSVTLHSLDDDETKVLAQGDLIVQAMRESGVMLANHINGAVYIMASPLASQLEYTTALESLRAVLSSL